MGSISSLQYGYLGHGAIGTNASPFDCGTASTRFHHASGRLGGMPGVYLCGACTHPGGSVIAINGRNAAMAVLEDQANAAKTR